MAVHLIRQNRQTVWCTVTAIAGRRWHLKKLAERMWAMETCSNALVAIVGRRLLDAYRTFVGLSRLSNSKLKPMARHSEQNCELICN